MEKLNRQKLNALDLCVVKILDNDNNIKVGYLVVRGNKYILLPFENAGCTYTYKLSHIKKITILSNGVELGR